MNDSRNHPPDIVRTLMNESIRSSQRVEETMLALLAEEGGYFFGMPIKWEITWPEGLPRQFRDREAVKAWAVERLAAVRKIQAEAS